MKYRHTPTVIEADLWTGNKADIAAMHAKYAVLAVHNMATGINLDIQAPSGVLTALPGDYLVLGIQGESYCVKPQIFLKSYVAV